MRGRVIRDFAGGVGENRSVAEEPHDESACRSRLGTFADCPHCGAEMVPEHAHYRCTGCGWRDSCCD